MAGSTQGDFFIRNTWVLYSVGAAAALLRIFIRLYLTHRLGIEDYLMFFSLLCWTGDTTLIVVTVRNGTNQMSPEDRARVTPEEVRRREIGSQSFVAAWFLYVTMIWGCKTCILLFYRRVTDKLEQKHIVMWTAYILGITYLVCIFTVALTCRPFKGVWQVLPDPGPQCTDGLYYVWIVGVLNIATDILLLAIPLPLIIKLRVNLQRKILLLGLFGLGIFVVVATILRIYFTVAGGSIANMTFWSMIETCTGMVVANAPGIRTIFVHKKGEKSTSNPSGYKPQRGSSYVLEPTSSRGKTRAFIGFGKGYGVGQATADITVTQCERGESTERIVDPGNPYVIHQHVSYEVNVSGESKSVINTDGSLESQYSLERHTHDQDQQHNGRSISRTSRASSLTDNDKRAG